MLLGLAKPDGGTVSVFGRPPREAVDAGLVGAMLQTGELIRDLSVRELVAMMASLYPDPMDVDEALEVTGLTDDRRPANAQALGRSDPACPFRARDRQQPRPAGARRADGRAGRRGPPRVLEHHARVRGPRQDGAVRHPLPRGGRRQRRPRDPDGPRADRRRRPDDRDQGARGQADAPRDAAGRRSVEPGRPARRRLRRAARRRGDPELRGLRPEHPGAARALSGGEGHRDHRGKPRGGVPGADGRAGRRRAGAGLAR